MEYSGQKRSNLLMATMIWFVFSSYILLKAIPYQLPIKSIAQLNFYRYSLIFTFFLVGVLIVSLITRDYRLLRAYAVSALVVLLVLMCREVEIERELLVKLRDGLVGFFVMPLWGWSRILEDNTEIWVSSWCACSGVVAFFAARLFVAAPYPSTKGTA